MSLAARGRSLWIFSAPADLLVFALPALLSVGVILFTPLGAEGLESPAWLWIGGVLLVDVAHVWSTGFITYLDPAELRRHPERYWLVPGVGWVLGVVLYSLGGATSFWRCLAYVAVFHFVRQQYGWMALYRARAGERERLGALIDGAAIYAATLYPLIWWHAHLPRSFAWFVPDDFVGGVPPELAALAGGAHAVCLAAYAVRALTQAWRRQPVPWGKHLLLLGTAATWYVGIVARNGDAGLHPRERVCARHPLCGAGVLVWAPRRSGPGGSRRARVEGPRLGGVPAVPVLPVAARVRGGAALGSRRVARALGLVWGWA